MSDASVRLSSLVVLGGELHGRRLDLEEAVDEVLIGSDPDCRFHLDLPTISPIHARIWMDLEGATVHDTHSPRGVFLNMERVAGEAPLQEGDMLWLGPPQEPGSVMIQCRFEERAGAEPTAPPAEALPEEAGLDELMGLEPPPPPGSPALPEDEPLGVLAEEEEVPRWRATAEAEALAATESPEPLEPVTPEPEPPAAPEPSLEMPVGASAAGFDDFLIEGPGAPVPSPPSAPRPQEEFSVGGFAPQWPEPPPPAMEAKADEFFIEEPSAGAALPPEAPPSAPLSSEEDPFFLADTPTAPPAAAPPPTPADDSAFFIEDAGAAPPAAAAVPPAFVVEEAPFLSEAAPEPAPVAPPPAARPQPPATAASPPPAPAAAPPAKLPARPVPPATRPAASPPPAAAKPAAEPPPRPRPGTGAAPPTAPSAAAPPAAPPRRRPEGPGVSQRLEAVPRPTPRADRSIPPRARGRSRVPVGRLAALGVGAAALIGLGVFLARGYLGAARLDGIEPTRARVGQTVTLTGGGFAAQPEGNVVMFGGKPGRVARASETRLEVEVPDVAAAAGQDTRVRVRVRARGGESRPLEIAVYQGPTVHGISTDVALPGDEVTLAGSGWGIGVQVRFGTVPAEILQTGDSELKVRVPPLPGGPGTSAPVVVSVGAAESNPLPFFVGRLPLVLGVEPRAAAPGDLVTVAGRGFRRESGQNDVQIGGARALVVSAIDTELKVEVPRLAGEGDRPLEVRVPGSETVGQSTLAVSASADPVELRFFAEPFDAAPGRDHALLATGLGPAFVVAAAGGRSAAERAVEAQRRLNDAAGALKATRGLSLEVRNLETAPALAVTGRPEILLEVREEDAAAYNEDWTRLRGRGGPVTRGRLARWWEALGRDLVLMLVRGEKPQYAAALAPEGRALGELFQLAQKAGGFGVPRKVVAEAKPGLRESLRLLAFRVPPSVRDVSAAGAATPAAPTGPPPLRLEGAWTGSELEGGTRRWVTITFTANGGRLSYEGTVTLTIPLETLDQPQKDSVRYSLQFRGGMRYYVGKWDGATISGKISSDAAGAQPLGTFELRPR